MSENDLVHQHLPLVRAIVNRIAMNLPAHADIDGLHGAGLLGLMRAIRRYDGRRGAQFGTYARIRIRGAVLDELRRLSKTWKQVFVTSDCADSRYSHPDRLAEHRDLCRIIAKRIKTMPAMQRTVLALHYFEGLRIREIAETFGVTPSRISMIKAQAVHSIRSFLLGAMRI